MVGEGRDGPLRPDAAVELSVIVGCRRAEVAPFACLEALSTQLRPGVEIILAEDGGSDAYPGWVRRVVRPGALVPELWAAGLAEAGGRLVALTAAGVVPDAGWVDRLLEATASGVAAAGGAVEPGERLTLVDWAVYFCRYTGYMLPFEADDKGELAGDNAVYDADVLARYAGLWRDAFWEPFVHRAMRADGHRLVVTPEFVVHQARGFDARAFARQRFLHGRHYGRLRSEGQPRVAVVKAALAVPAVPWLMLARAARNTARRRRHLARFALAAPLVLWFYSWWALGELAGRLGAVAGR